MRADGIPSACAVTLPRRSARNLAPLRLQLREMQRADRGAAAAMSRGRWQYPVDRWGGVGSEELAGRHSTTATLGKGSRGVWGPADYRDPAVGKRNGPSRERDQTVGNKPRRCQRAASRTRGCRRSISRAPVVSDEPSLSACPLRWVPNSRSACHRGVHSNPADVSRRRWWYSSSFSVLRKSAMLDPSGQPRPGCNPPAFSGAKRWEAEQQSQYCLRRP